MQITDTSAITTTRRACHRLQRLLATAALCLLATGCTLPLSLPWDAERVRDGSILAYYHWVDNADPQALARDREHYAQRYRRSGSISDGVRLALLMSQPADSSAGERQRALEILQTQMAAAREAEREQPRESVLFARLWHDVLSQRIQYTDSQQMIRQLRRENQDLEQQIEALKTIEQQLNQREQIQEPSL